MIHNNSISQFIFFHLFHIFSYKKKKVSVTDISQKFEKKNTSTSSQTTSKCTIPFSSSYSSSSLLYHSFICLILSIHPQKNAVLVFSKQKTKTAEDSHLCSNFFSFLFKTKQNKSCFCTGQTSPGREISTATTFCVRQLSNALGPVWATRVPEQWGTRQPGKSLCSPKSTSYMFSKEKQKRYSFTGKIHNPKLPKYQGDQASGISGRQIRCGQGNRKRIPSGKPGF